MTKILIDIDSIKDNPNAGKTQTVQLGEWTGSCMIKVYDRGELKVPLGCLVTAENVFPDHSIEYDIRIGSIEAYEELSVRTNVFNLEMSREHFHFSHLPEPKYIYDYENTPVQCSNCLQMIPVRKIEIETIDAGSKCGSESIETTICPLCDDHNTLEYEYETIDEALTRCRVKM